jgi:polyhydroxybutyrate depolymerase
MPRAVVAVVLSSLLFTAACSSDSDTAAETTTVPDITEPADSTPTTAPAPETTATTRAAGCAANEPGASSFSIDAGGATHAVRVFVPSSYDGSPMPLVMNWHGLGSDGPQQAQFSDYETLAEKEGFLVAHPTGVPAPGDTRNSWELEQFDVPGRDDVAMAEATIDQIIADFCADPKRVYSTGMSNGGLFTSRLVCDLSTRIAAAVAVAGVTHHDGCAPERAVPFIAFHGTADDVVPFDGGGSILTEDDAPPLAIEFFNQVMPDEFAQFAATNGCDLDPTEEAVSAEVIRYDYANCNNDAGMTFFEITEGGHTWPGSPLGPLLGEVLGYTTTDVSATADGWDFMKQYELP